MTRAYIAPLLVTVLASTFMPAFAGPANAGAGAYIGLSAGNSYFSKVDLATQNRGVDDTDRAYKLYAGYQITERFGAEAGYLRFGQYQSTFTVAGQEVRQSADARTVYLAATARMPLNERFALRGRLGVAANEVSGRNQLPAGESIVGTKTQPIVGVGADYRLTPELSLTADLDAVGKLSEKLSGGAFTIGLRASF